MRSISSRNSAPATRLLPPDISWWEFHRTLLPLSFPLAAYDACDLSLLPMGFMYLARVVCYTLTIGSLGSYVWRIPSRVDHAGPRRHPGVSQEGGEDILHEVGHTGNRELQSGR